MAKKNKTKDMDMDEAELDNQVGAEGDEETIAEERRLARLPLTIQRQYIKDLSFENPNAPYTLAGDRRPKMNVNFGIEVDRFEPEKRDDAYEVQLAVNVTAHRDGKPSFIVEVVYGVLCLVQDVPEEKIHPLLMMEVPRFAFPFVRQLIAQMTSQAGYMPLLLTPFDFTAFYKKRFGDAVPVIGQDEPDGKAGNKAEGKDKKDKKKRA